MNDNKKKRYVNPEAEIIDFAHDDILTISGNANWWIDDDNQEELPLDA